jgi:hypothetical protein
MSSQNSSYLDGNAAGGELGNIFALDITAATGQCSYCGATRRFAEAHLYVQGPGIVARCPVCEHVLLRLANIRERLLLDLRGMTHLTFELSDAQEPA